MGIYGETPLFRAGERVTIRTTNGGEVTARLAENHYRTL